MVWTGDGVELCRAGAACPAHCQDRAVDLWAGISDQPGFRGPLRTWALLKRHFGAGVRQDGSLMRCFGGRMTIRFASAAQSPLVQHRSRYSLSASDPVTCRREGS
jgi:hypothetical protein